MNIFRSESNRKFLKNEQSLSEIPDRKTVQKEMKDIVTTKLSTLSRAADFYGIQLDHWTNRHKLNVLVILASYIDSKWAFGLQVIDFKLVPNTTGIITAEEVIESLSQVGLNPQSCISYQSDNCSSMIKSARDFRRLTGMEINEEAEHSVEDTFSAAPNEEIDPFRQFVGCGAHRLNFANQGAINGMPLFSQANAFCLKFVDPKLCDIRWYGHLQLKFLVSKLDLLAAERVALEHELLTFIDTVNEDRPAFQFFRAEKTKWPQLSHAARIILCTLPSPACAERAFSRAALLTDSRRTRLKMDNLNTRLII